MSQFGKSIRIYLKDGTVTGIKFGEVVNQTIQSISCPRSRLNELSFYIESKRPGLYFLFGLDDDSISTKAYIGEAENVYDRLQQHLASKDFWSEVIFFVSKDENLTKSHVKYLESRSIEIANKTQRYKIENYNLSQPSSLPRPDRDAMEEFLVYVKLLLGILGHKFLEEVAPIKTSTTTSIPLATKAEESKVIVSPANIELFLQIKGHQASALQTDEGIVVLSGSEAAKEITDKLQIGYKELRKSLINNEILVLEGNKYIFKKDYLFPTASPAAAVIAGFSINGRVYWKDSNGNTLKDIEEGKIKV